MGRGCIDEPIKKAAGRAHGYEHGLSPANIPFADTYYSNGVLFLPIIIVATRNMRHYFVISVLALMTDWTLVDCLVAQTSRLKSKP